MFWPTSLVMLDAPCPPAPMTAMLTLSLADSLRAAPRAGPANAPAAVPASMPRRVIPCAAIAFASPLLLGRHLGERHADWQGQGRSVRKHPSSRPQDRASGALRVAAAGMTKWLAQAA